MARGTLRIYLGAAPGVGKTFAMLDEGRRRARVRRRRRRRLRRDPRPAARRPSRSATSRSCRGRRIELPRHGASRRWTSTPSSRGGPQVALVDELAHTNVPGSRNEKRWQDVEELLDAGIDVISTVNIQHLESLNDVVEQITGVKQRETVPDEVVRRADQLELVDMTPRGAPQPARPRQHLPARADRRRARQLLPARQPRRAARARAAWVADRVDEGARRVPRDGTGSSEPWETRERVVVALTGLQRRRAARPPRGAHRAARRRATSSASTSSRRTASRPRRPRCSTQQRELVEELGGTYHEVVGADVGEALLDAARSLNATQIVHGREPALALAAAHARLGDRQRDPRVGRRASTSTSISHPEARSEDAFVVPRTRRPAALAAPARSCSGSLLAAVGLPLLTLRARPAPGPARAAERAAPLPAARRRASRRSAGSGPALAAAVGGFLLVNWFFIAAAPHVHDRRGRERARALRLPRRRRDRQRLRRARRPPGGRGRARPRRGRGARAARRLRRPAPAVLDSLRRVLGLDGAAVLHRHDGGWRIEAASGDRVPESPGGEHARRSSSTHEHVLALAGAPIRSEDQRVLDAFAEELAASVELGELEAEAEAAGALAAANELRAALLSAVSHDLRTPLAAIKASVTSLLQRRRRLDARGAAGVPRNDRRGDRPAQRPRRQPARHEPPPGRRARDQRRAGRPRRGRARRARTASASPTARVELDVPETLPRVLADRGLLERALANVISNAVRFSPPARRRA